MTTAAENGAPARLLSRTLLGLYAQSVTAECHVRNGLPSTTIVGLPEATVREARDRVKSAIINSGFDYPDGGVVINLAPGGIVKSGSALDLPIALSILAATGQLARDQLAGFEFIGELGLFGELRAVPGALACAVASHRAQRRLIVPAANAKESQVAPPNSIYLAGSLADVGAAFNFGQPSQLPHPSAPDRQAHGTEVTSSSNFSFAHVIGQQAAKRALIIAAGGGHHLLMVGPPGTGKTMLAKGFAELLPPLDAEASLEVAALYSAAGLTREDYHTAPFREPHHSASTPALIGGGNPPSPGEAALAHRGVLFLDELPHFKPSVLNLLREPIETGQAVIARANYTVTFPCRFQLIAAMNPCPAGRTCSEGACRCTSAQVQRYQSRISGPLLDRIDLHVSVPALPEAVLAKLESQPAADNFTQIQRRIERIRVKQTARQGALNAVLDHRHLREHMARAEIDKTFLHNAIERYRLSARSYHKLWRVALTIADLEEAERISLGHMTEALSYRALDWEAGAA